MEYKEDQIKKTIDTYWVNMPIDELIHNEYKEEQIRKLIDAYWEGETTLKEEADLKEYFSTAQQIPSDLMYLKALFTHFKETADEECKIELPQTNGLLQLHHSSNKILLRIASIAAVMAVCTLTCVLALKPSPVIYCYVNGKPITDKELALKYTQKELAFINQNMVDPMSYIKSLDLDNSIETVDNILNLTKITTKK